jgi:hypothetical protein
MGQSMSICRSHFFIQGTRQCQRLPQEVKRTQGFAQLRPLPTWGFHQMFCPGWTLPSQAFGHFGLPHSEVLLTSLLPVGLPPPRSCPHSPGLLPHLFRSPTTREYREYPRRAWPPTGRGNLRDCAPSEYQQVMLPTPATSGLLTPGALTPRPFPCRIASGLPLLCLFHPGFQNPFLCPCWT